MFKRLADWWANPRIPLSARRRLQVAWVIIAITLIGWPISLFVFPNEPPFILSLSWLAITITALDVVSTSDVSAEQQKE